MCANDLSDFVKGRVEVRVFIEEFAAEKFELLAKLIQRSSYAGCLLEHFFVVRRSTQLQLEG